MRSLQSFTLFVFTVFFFTLLSLMVLAKPVITVTKVDSPDPVLVGSRITYVVTINNTNTSADAQNVTLFETYDVNTIFSSAVPNATGTSSLNNTWNLSTLNSTLSGGNHTTINITVLVNGSLSNGTLINNTITVHFNTSGANSTVFAVNASITTTVIVPPVLAVTKSDMLDPVRNGSFVSYSLNITNNGSLTAYNITVVDTYDGNLSTVRAPTPAANDTANTTFFIERLFPGNHTTINITVYVNSTVVNATPINNSVRVNYNTTAFSVYYSSNASAVTTVNNDVPLLTIVKTATPATAVLGTNNLDYVINITNPSGSTAQDVVVNDTFDDRLEYDPGTSSFPLFANGSTFLTWRVNVSPASSVIINFSLIFGS